jgi:hypothetical protein
MPIPNTWNDVMLVMGLNDLVTQTRPVSLVVEEFITIQLIFAVW